MVLFLLGDIENAVGVLAPFRLYDVPDLLDRVELAALRRQELVVEERVVELLLHNEAVMDAEVVHDHDPLQEGVDQLQLLDERQEGVHGVTAEENLSMQQAMLDAQSSYHRNTLTPLIWELHLHPSLDPHRRWLHPEVEGGLIDVDDISVRLGH